jgi:1,2-diacylglycerol 3-alpha-glucosyltransferase
MNIGFFADCWEPQINGVVVSMKNLKTALEDRGHAIDIYAPAYGCERRSTDLIFRQPSVTYPFQREFNMAAPFPHRARRRARERRLDIVHAHTEFPLGQIGAAVARRLAVPLVFTLHTLWVHYFHYVFWGLVPDNILKTVLRRFYLKADYFVAPSGKIKSYLEKEFGIAAHIETIPTGLDLERFFQFDPGPARKAEFRTRHGLHELDTVLVFAGRLGREKSIDLLMTALPLLLPRHPRLKLLLVGDGPARGELESLAETLGVRKAVVFTGYLRGESLPLAYACADFFVIASTSESQGLVTVEAMASGLPVVMREDAASLDILGDRRNGIVWRDPGEFVAALETLLTHRELVDDLKRRSRERSRAFTLAAFGERMEGYYDWILGDFNRRRSSLARP